MNENNSGFMSHNGGLEIKKIDESIIRFEIDLIADPLQENILGVLENL